MLEQTTQLNTQTKKGIKPDDNFFQGLNLSEIKLKKQDRNSKDFQRLDYTLEYNIWAYRINLPNNKEKPVQYFTEIQNRFVQQIIETEHPNFETALKTHYVALQEIKKRGL